MEKSIRVKIKTWAEMTEEFGNPHNTRCCFTKSMENAMPKNRIINVSMEHSQLDYLWITEYTTWHISEDMIKAVVPKHVIF